MRRVSPDLQNLVKDIAISTRSKIVLLVIDGLGGLPGEEGSTELEKATTPNLDTLAGESICGMIDPIVRGITPGSGPAHLALFGYNPLEFQIGRGALSAAGIGFNLELDDVAARINFATVDEEGKVRDRRAGRISTETNKELCQLLDGMQLEGVEFFVRAVKEHRAVVVFRGEGLSDKLNDSDPQKTGAIPIEVKALSPEAEKTAQIVNEFIRQARGILSGHHPANMILLRGFAKSPGLPSFPEIYRLRSAAIAAYPMYRGIARLMGMDILSTGEAVEEEFKTLRENFDKYDFFFLHIKGADSAGEDGDFKRKVKVIEEVDENIPTLRDLGPEVIAITGDHSTPSVLKLHSWHSVPFLLRSEWCRPDKVDKFSEESCLRQGGLGRFPAVEVMPLLLAHALKLTKYGA
ncbi:2,3-bisphosphoglycerate-independent phosphoglycerate mutase [candidate division NPL-UPA2 bacterium]|nr:2,3-bisphosphoglycerate-independent phosphoglycerate mutase [candidate division NPL-UPA2 bacterium]